MSSRNKEALPLYFFHPESQQISQETNLELNKLSPIKSEFRKLQKLINKLICSSSQQVQK